ncbi:MAG: hypothetical protein ABL877_10920 [Thiobacillus sp.]
MSAPEREIPSRLLNKSPLDILIAEESKTCRGCTNQHTERLWGQDYTICTDKDANGKRRNHGKRCKAYNNPGETA